MRREAKRSKACYACGTWSSVTGWRLTPSKTSANTRASHGRHDRVAGALHDEERWSGIGRHAHRRGGLVPIAGLGHRDLHDPDLEQLVESATPPVALAVREVVDAVHRRAPGHRRVGIFEAGLVEPGVSEASVARWPPAEPPVMTMRVGSPPCSAMLAFTQAMASFTSTMWSGKVAFGERR